MAEEEYIPCEVAVSAAVTIAQVIVGEVTNAQAIVGEGTIAQAIAGEVTVGEVVVGEATFAEVTVAVTIAEVPVGEAVNVLKEISQWGTKRARMEEGIVVVLCLPCRNECNGKKNIVFNESLCLRWCSANGGTEVCFIPSNGRSLSLRGKECPPSCGGGRHLAFNLSRGTKSLQRVFERFVKNLLSIRAI